MRKASSSNSAFRCFVSCLHAATIKFFYSRHDDSTDIGLSERTPDNMPGPVKLRQRAARESAVAAPPLVESAKLYRPSFDLSRLCASFKAAWGKPESECNFDRSSAVCIYGGWHLLL
jgi:hypothetical protein